MWKEVAPEPGQARFKTGKRKGEGKRERNAGFPLIFV